MKFTLTSKDKMDKIEHIYLSVNFVVDSITYLTNKNNFFREASLLSHKW